jgi:hypothetical protein
MADIMSLSSSSGVVLSLNASWTQIGDITILNYIYGSGSFPIALVDHAAVCTNAFPQE